jgi:uncharacterized membrane protein YhaH (DUF805 family)
VSGLEEADPATGRWQQFLFARQALGLYPYLRQGAAFSLVALAAGIGSFFFFPLALLIPVVYYLFGVATLKRLRDMDRGWYWLFLALLPFVGPILISLALSSDTAGEPGLPSLFRFPLATGAVFGFQCAFFLALVFAGFAETGESVSFLT